MMKSTTRTLTLAVALTLGAGAFDQGMMPAKTADTAKGKAFVDDKGMTLYTFAKDTKAGDMMGDGVLNGAWHIATP